MHNFLVNVFVLSLITVAVFFAAAPQSQSQDSSAGTSNLTSFSEQAQNIDPSALGGPEAAKEEVKNCLNSYPLYDAYSVEAMQEKALDKASGGKRKCFELRYKTDDKPTTDAQGLQDISDKINSTDCLGDGICLDTNTRIADPLGYDPTSQQTQSGQSPLVDQAFGGSSGGQLPTDALGGYQDSGIDDTAFNGYTEAGTMPQAYAGANDPSVPPLPERNPAANPPLPQQNEWKEEPKIPKLWPEVKDRLIRMTHAEKCSSTTNIDHCTAFAGTPIKRALNNLQRKGIPLTEESFNRELMRELRWTDQGGYYQSDSANKNRFSGLTEGTSAWDRAETAVNNALSGQDPTSGMMHNYYFSNKSGIDSIAEADAFFKRTTGTYGHGVQDGTFVKVPGGYELYYVKDNKRGADEIPINLSQYQGVQVADGYYTSVAQNSVPLPDASPMRNTTYTGPLMLAASTNTGGISTPLSTFSNIGSNLGNSFHTPSAPTTVTAQSFISPYEYIPQPIPNLSSSAFSNIDYVSWLGAQIRNLTNSI